MTSVESLQSKYSDAMIWSFGDDAGIELVAEEFEVIEIIRDRQ